MSDIVKSAPFCFVIDQDFNTEWIDICELESLDIFYLPLYKKVFLFVFSIIPPLFWWYDKKYCGKFLHTRFGEVDGCLGGRLYYDQDCGCGNGRYITGVDWYGFQETVKGVNYLQTNTEEDANEERYKKIVKVRGMNVPESVICQFNKDLKVA